MGLFLVFFILYVMVLPIFTFVIYCDLKDWYGRKTQRKMQRFDLFFPAYPIARWLAKEIE